MSGAEAIAVLGVISSIISIIDGTKQIYDAATNARGLPEAFREVADRLPVIESILNSAKRHVEEKNIDNDSCQGVRHVVEACEEKAKKLDELFRKAIPADDTSDLKRYYKAVKAWGKGNEVENLMKGMLEDVQLLACERGMETVTEAQQEQIIEAITKMSAFSIGPSRDEAQACLSALFLTDPRDDRANLIFTKGPRVDGTCQWIENHALYDSWLHSYPQLLWLSGGPGKGKTMLSIFLAEQLEKIAKASQNQVFLQYFCDNKDEKRNTAVAILRGLIYQLLQSRQQLFDHILPTFRIQSESLLSFEPLWRIFESMICDSTLETTYCVLDGLDECDQTSLEVILGRFTALLSRKTNGSTACHLNLLIVSRDLPDCIPELLSSFPRISLDPDADTEINNDIDLFIKTKATELSRRKQYPHGLRVHVENVFRQRAQGTFLWIGIVAQTLEKYKVTEVEEALDLFPPGLDQLYARILLQIDISRRKVAAKILRWVVMAVRPLTLSELSIAIDTPVEPSTVILNPNQRMIDRVSYCGNLLKLKGDEVSLIHQSAKDYLSRKTYDSNPGLEVFRVKEEATNLEIARKCLDYLHGGALDNIETEILRNGDHLRAFPLLSYAALHWHEHARFVDCSEDIFDLSHRFYHKNSPIRSSWLKQYWAWEHHGDESPESFTLLHLASYFGILPLVQNILLTENWIKKMKRRYYLNKCDSLGVTALIWAASGGYEAIVRLLLEKGADIETKDTLQQTALMHAVIGGHEAIVRLLLEKGADIEARRVYQQQTALLQAVDYGEEAIVRLLLENRADINARDRHGETALMKAVIQKSYEYMELTFEERQAVARLLLENGADVNARDENGQTALMKVLEIPLHRRWAAEERQAVVRLLLENGADVNARDCNGRTALIMAEERKDKAIIQLLTP